MLIDWTEIFNWDIWKIIKWIFIITITLFIMLGLYFNKEYTTCNQIITTPTKKVLYQPQFTDRTLLDILQSNKKTSELRDK